MMPQKEQMFSRFHKHDPSSRTHSRTSNSGGFRAVQAAAREFEKKDSELRLLISEDGSAPLGAALSWARPSKK